MPPQILGDPWEQNSKFHDGRLLAKYIREQRKHLRDNDLAFSPMFLDVQYDRSRDDALAETPIRRPDHLRTCLQRR